MQELLLLSPDLYQDSDEDMKLRDEDKKWLSGEIAEQLKNANATLLDSLKPHGWRKAAFRLRELGPVATIIAAFLTLLAIAAGAVYQATARVAKEAIFETNTERDIKDIKTAIQGIQVDLAKQSLINHAALPLPDFKTTLSEVGSAIASANQQEVKVAPSVIGNLQHKLIAAGDNAPGFWPATAEFISYRSFNTVNGTFPVNLPTCTDRKPLPMEVFIGQSEERTRKLNEEFPQLSDEAEGTKSEIKVLSALYQDCRFTLDSPEETARIPDLGQGRSYVVTFRHCQIVYHGGQVTLLTPHPGLTAITGKSATRSDVLIMSGQTVRFENCLFVFLMSSQPPSEGQQLTQQLLTQSGSVLTVRAAKPRRA
jgi:hypothetical protein